MRVKLRLSYESYVKRRRRPRPVSNAAPRARSVSTRAKREVCVSSAGDVRRPSCKYTRYLHDLSPYYQLQRAGPIRIPTSHNVDQDYNCTRRTPPTACTRAPEAVEGRRLPGCPPPLLRTNYYVLSIYSDRGSVLPSS